MSIVQVGSTSYPVIHLCAFKLNFLQLQLVIVIHAADVNRLIIISENSRKEFSGFLPVPIANEHSHWHFTRAALRVCTRVGWVDEGNHVHAYSCEEYHAVMTYCGAFMRHVYA